MNGCIETTCVHTKKNVLELEKTLHRRTWRICMLLTLLGVVLFGVGAYLEDPSCMYFGIFWTLCFQILSNHAARKATRRLMKHYKKLYGQPVETNVKFYQTAFVAKNAVTGSETKAKYEDVERVVITQHLYTLVLPDRIAVMADRRGLSQEEDTELYRLIVAGCPVSAFVQNRKK